MVSPENNIVYVVFYINVDEPEYSEVLGVYKDKYSAVCGLLEKASYREIDGQLTYYMEPTNDYESLEELKDKVMEDMELNDLDIYRIMQMRVYN
jgi:hypothetical protein